MSRFESVAFIGGGRVVRILLEGWKQAERMPSRVVAVEPDPVALDRLLDLVPEVSVEGHGSASDCDLVFLAVHPPVMASALKGLEGALRQETVVVSLAPKIHSETISKALGINRIVRMIPNAPSTIGAGFNPVCFSDAIEPETKEELQALFSPWGEQPEVAEVDLEAYAVITAMGPTYFWYQIQELRELAVSFGLGPWAADEAVGKMVSGAVRCLLDHGPECIDLIPVRPLADLEPMVREALESKLKATYRKLTT